MESVILVIVVIYNQLESILVKMAKSCKELH